jgi:hypothetical protein
MARRSARETPNTARVVANLLPENQGYSRTSIAVSGTDEGCNFASFYNFFSRNMFLPCDPAVSSGQKASSPSEMRR